MKLSMLVVSTTVAGFLLATPAAPSIVAKPAVLGATIAGTVLCSFAANTLNQWVEAPLDSQMARTRCRVLPTLRLSSFHAFHFAVATGCSGVALLAWQANGLAAALAATTIGLYAFVYTPLKRISIANTWVGALVGAIPPLIGYAGALSSPTVASLFPEGLFLAAVLYCWQFPHFNPLSWNLRREYARAGLLHGGRPAACCQPECCAGLCGAPGAADQSAPLFLTTPLFAVDGNVLNSVLVYLDSGSDATRSRQNGRRLFLYSLLHLPVYLVLLLVHTSRCRHDATAEGKKA